MTSKFELKILTQLRSAELTQDMATSHLKKLAAIAQEIEFETDTVIYRRGDAGKGVYLIETGEVVIEMEIPGHGLVILNTLGPEDFFGWSSLFPSWRKMAWTRSVTSTKVIMFDAEQLRKECRTNHEFEYAVIRRASKSTAERIKANRQQLINLTTPQSQ